MKRLVLIFLLCIGLPLMIIAAHIRGGEMYYRYLGTTSDGRAQYLVTVKLYLNCGATGGQLDPYAPFTIFDKSNNTQVGSVIRAPYRDSTIIRYDPNSNPCITNPPDDVCYMLRYYETTITLAPNTQGYIIALQRCCRIADIVNMTSPSNNYGSTYTAEIPGTALAVTPAAWQNNSPQFNPNDAVAICYGSPFTFDFSATDTDGDSIVYQLCDAYSGGGTRNDDAHCAQCAQPEPAVAPPYNSIPYRSPYSGSVPLGLNASINSKTGILSGVAPNVEGQYVVTACAYEYRQGVLISIHRKDIHIRVADCIPLKATLKPDYDYCDDFNVTFKNETVNPPNSVYIWSYGDNTKSDTTTNLEGMVQHLFADTGTYTIKLKVILAGQCVDSTTTLAKVYPGFFPAFDISGTCLYTSIQFFDQTQATYGVVSKWRWSFGDETVTNDSSIIKNPSWKYSTLGFKTVQLIVESSKGCIDTISKQAEVRDKPLITLPFKDTLICANVVVQDTLQLHASGNGTFSWSPVALMVNSTSADPLVFPKTTTVYHVQLNENGCINEDSVRVRVVDVVTLDAGPPQTICRTDTTQLMPVTDALKWTWTSNPTPSPISDPTVKNPLVSPPDAVTTYNLLGEIGKCSAQDQVTVTTVPYPIARAGVDTTICFDDTASLNASIVAARFTWSPVSTLSNAFILNPLAFPRRTTVYILKVEDDLGCPKAVYDTVVVNVLPQLFAFAGNDTAVVLGQPLQLTGSGAEFFEWTPATYLNRNDIYNPMASLNNSFTYQLRVSTKEGCFDLDTINIKVFRTNPQIFVPNAFRPDGYQNNVLRPIPVGISKLLYFKVFNRWGQQVFQTTQPHLGWDGKVAGKPQDSGVYVWIVSGTDYTGKTVTQKGTAVLLR